MNIRLFLILFSFSVISGCATQTAAQLRAIDQNACRNAGFEPKSATFTKCLKKRDLQRAIDKRIWQDDQDIKEGLPLPYPPF